MCCSGPAQFDIPPSEHEDSRILFVVMAKGVESCQGVGLMKRERVLVGYIEDVKGLEWRLLNKPVGGKPMLSRR